MSEAIKSLFSSYYSRWLKQEVAWRTSGCARARTYTQSVSCSFKLRSLTLTHSFTQPGRDRERRRRSANIAEFSGIPRIYSSDSDPTVGAGARRVFGLYFHLTRRTSARRKRSSSDSGIRYVSRPLDARPAAGKTPLHIWLWCLLCVYCGPIGADGKKRNVKCRSHGTRSLVHKQDAVVKSWTVFNYSWHRVLT